MKRLRIVGCIMALAACAPVHAASLDEIRTDNLDIVSDMAASTVGISDEAITAAELEQVRFAMKDPESAQFRGVRVVSYESGKVVCGEVNAKNSYGGYVGFTPFVAGARGGAYLYYETEYSELKAAANSGLIAACGGRP